MAETRTSRLGFTDDLPDACHVCMIFDDDEQRHRIVSEYLAAGLRRNDRTRYFADRTAPDQIRAWLDETGPERAAAEGRGAFAFVPAVDAYCPGGAHVPQRIIDGLMGVYDAARKGGYAGSRVCAEMSWVKRGLPGSDRFLEYEGLLNLIDTDFPHIGMCQYDARVFDGLTLFKVLQVHPFMVAQGQIVRNPYYVKPAEVVRRP
jgi:hypothetical protein